MAKILRLFVAVCLFSYSLLTHSQHDAHVHGEAVLNVASDGAALELQLESPTMNFLGFEHQPQTEEHHEIIRSTTEILENPGELFLVTGRTCEVESSSVEIKGPAGEHTKHDDHHQDDHHQDDMHHDGHHHDEAEGENTDKHEAEHDKHEDHHDEAHHDHGEDKDEHEHEDEHHGDHSEIIASYKFNCDGGDPVESIDVRLFERFKALEKIKVSSLSLVFIRMFCHWTHDNSISLADAEHF
ncbi:MAG: DUF2796 domain-containing protein, partial [Pseudomonadota bacterium]